jgi:hypothetical protein
MPRDPVFLSTLPRAQLALWPGLAEFKEGFVLYGGTALALQLGHRESVDFDFFTSRSFQPGDLTSRFHLLNNVEILQAFPNTLTVIKNGTFGEVKMSFFGGLNLARVAPPIASADNGLRIASVLDLSGTKVKVLQDRAELKDYIDLAAVIRHGISLESAVRSALTIYGNNFNPMPSLKALTYFEDGDLRHLDADTRRLLENAVKGVDIRALRPFMADRALFDEVSDHEKGPAVQAAPRKGMEP